MVFIIICAVFAVLTDQFLTISNISDVIKTNTVNGLLAVGLTYVILSGGIDLSVDATVCLGRPCGGVFKQYSGAGSPGRRGHRSGSRAFNGAVLEKSGVQPFIFTLAMSRVVRGIVMAGTKGKNYYLISEN